MRKALFFILCIAFSSFSIATSAAAPQGDSPWQVNVGLFAGVFPKYLGSNEYRFLAYPNFNIKWNRLLFLSPMKGLGIYLLNKKNIKISTSVSYQFIKEERDDEIPGLNDVGRYFSGNFFFDYIMRPFSFDVDYKHAINHTSHGGYLDLATNLMMPLTRQLIMRIGPSVRWSDADHMKTEYGVNAQQAASSGLPQFSTSAGFERVSGNLMLDYQLAQRWSLDGFGRISHLLNSAKNSPIINKATQYYVGFGINYKLIA